MSPAVYEFLWLIAAPLSSVVAVIMLTLSSLAWMRRHHPTDILLALVMLGWLIFLLAGRYGSSDENPPLPVYVARAGYQVALFGTMLFLLLSASVTRFEVYAFWMTHGAAGLLLITSIWWGPLEHDWVFGLSERLNLACAVSVSLLIGLMVYRQETFRRWLALAGSLVAVAICVEDLRTTDHTHLGVPLAQYFFAALLLLFWLLLTDRVGLRLPAAVLTSVPPEPSGSDAAASAGHQNELASQAVAEERRRIALDLHDGVGSQLVRILATLESNMPHQQALALTLELEQCLLDLKLTVDRIDGADDSVIDALGRLRYRVQPAMEKLGIRLIWSVDVEGPLQEFKGDPAQEVLCIAQEGLSNVIRHASATVVVLICRYVAASKVMLLEVRDNGRGAAGQFTSEPSGKGLEGMRRRARKLGGHVQIAIRTGLGTRIRLSVPFNPTGQETATLDELPAEQMQG